MATNYCGVDVDNPSWTPKGWERGQQPNPDRWEKRQGGYFPRERDTSFEMLALDWDAQNEFDRQRSAGFVMRDLYGATINGRKTSMDKRVDFWAPEH